LTEALARDRTRHQVSEVTSLGLVQLTRKRLGTGLIEAFSTTCPHCGGRGITLHADPVDSAPATGRKSESGGKRGRRSKKGKSDEQEVAKVPVHTPGEHPMFKAMAAANGRHDDESDDAERTEDVDEAVGAHDRDDAETDGQIQQQVAREVAEEDLQDGDFDDTDEDDTDEDDTDEDDTDEDDTEEDDTDEDDTDEDDTDEDDTEEDDTDEDVEVDLDDDEDLDDEDLEDDDEDDEDDEDDDDEGDEADDLDLDDDLDGDESAVTAPAAQPRRRRAAARPAGPPIHED
jgi:ribonuclease E